MKLLKSIIILLFSLTLLSSIIPSSTAEKITTTTAKIRSGEQLKTANAIGFFGANAKAIISSTIFAFSDSYEQCTKA